MLVVELKRLQQEDWKCQKEEGYSELMKVSKGCPVMVDW